MIIRISSRDGTKSIQIRKVLSYESLKRTNDIGSLKISIPITHPGIDKFQIKKGYLVNAYFQYSKHDVICVFSGFVGEPKVSNSSIEIFAYDIMGYARHRQIRTALSYVNTPIKDIISGVFGHINSYSDLPFSIGINDITDQISIDFAKNTTLFDCISQIYSKKKDLQFRVVHKKDGDAWINVFDFSVDPGKKIPGVWIDNQLIGQKSSNILDWSRADSFDDFCNRLVSDNGAGETVTEDLLSINDCGLFEKYEYSPEGSTTEINTSFTGIPTLAIDTDKIARRDVMVGDKVQVSIISSLDWFAFDYDNCIVQETKIYANSGGSINFTAKVGPKLVKDTNILNKTLEKYVGIINKLIKN